MFDALGLDADDLEWQDLAICTGQDIKRFHESYESNPRVAKLTDEMCLSCPVQQICLQTGIDNKEWGCWGGVFLVNGNPDPAKNAHKTQDIWEQIRANLT